ncbi:MAG: hypothetical protein V2A56_03925 [bacterium]
MKKVSDFSCFGMSLASIILNTRIVGKVDYFETEVVMSLLRAADEAIEARKLLHIMEQEINHLKLKEEDQTAFLELYWRIWDLVAGVVDELEHSLVPENQAIAVTFLPREKTDESIVAEAAPGYRVPRRGGDARGTLFLPSVSPDTENEQDDH